MSRTILIADDEPSLRLLVRVTIESAATRVIEAADGDQAWTLVQAERPAIALLDVQMPGRSGLELTRAIKADPSLGPIRVIMLTAKGQATDLDAGRAAGADDYLVKPFSPLALLRALDRQP